jgi:hypothetical protein
MFTDIATMSAINDLLRLARGYAELNDVPMSTVSSRVFNDGKKLAALENGADITVGRLEYGIGWFSEHWPEGGSWPEDISRPIAEETRT